MFDLIEVVDKLTGSIEPTFDKKVHEKHKDNLMLKTKLFIYLASEFKSASEERNGHEYLRDIGILADETVNEVLDILIDSELR